MERDPEQCMQDFQSALDRLQARLLSAGADAAGTEPLPERQAVEELLGRLLGERHDIQVRLQSQVNLYRALSATNQAVTRGDPPGVMFERICRIAVEHAGFSLAWIGVADSNAGEVVPLATAGPGSGYLQHIQVAWQPDIPEGMGPTASAIHQGQSFICNDFLQSVRTRPWHQAASDAGLGASAALPFRRGGEYVGALNVYAAQAGYFTPELIALLEEMASDIGFALDSYDQEQSLQHIGRERDWLVALLEATPDFIGLAEPDGRVTYHNPGARRMLGIEEVGNSYRAIDSAYPTWVQEMLQKEAVPTALRDGVWQGESAVQHASGKEIPVSQILIAHRDEQGQLCRLSTIARDISEQKRAEREIHYLAHFDTATGLPNRHSMTGHIDGELARAQAEGTGGAVLYIGLDRFKNVNDSCGHDAGDRVLRRVAERLHMACEVDVIVGRVGGDEFLVALSGLPGEDEQSLLRVRSTAEKLHSYLLRPIMDIASDPIYLQSSIGIALYPADGESAADLIKHSNIAMRRAKLVGGNGIEFFTPAMHEGVRRRAFLGAELRSALKKDQLQLHFQPQVDIDSGTIVGAEGLLRWEHPDKGLIPPAEFIPLAEEDGLIVQMGEWVIAEGLARVRQWMDDDLWRKGLSLSVNVSPRQFRHSEFLRQLRLCLEDSRVCASCFKLEITEGVAIEDIEGTIAKMNRIRELGVGFAMDDFGTGYSSLSYLKRLPLDVLKIDKVFVQDVLHDPSSAAIVRMIIGMAHSLRLQVVAEGVEQEQELAFLKAHDCHAYQGYHFSRPLPCADFAELLKVAV